VDGDGFDDIVVGNAVSERVDVYRGGADWSFSVTADVSVEQAVFPNGSTYLIYTTVTNSGPGTTRVRLLDHFPPPIANPTWFCYYVDRPAAAAASCLNANYASDPEGPTGVVGDIDSVITLPPGGAMLFYLTVGGVSLPVANTASVVLPEWVVDPDLSNNESTVVLGAPPPPPPLAIFADGFESGDVSAWSSSSASGLAVLPAAALEGTYGLRATASPSGAASVRDDSPSGEGAYHGRFRIDPNSFGAVDSNGSGAHGARTAALSPSSRAILFSGRSEGSVVPRFEVLLERELGKLSLVGRAATDGGPVSETAGAGVSDAPHAIDVVWRRATGPDANDGVFELQIDGVLAATLSGLDNDASGGIDSVELGLTVSGTLPPPGGQRTVILDSFGSWRLP
jgi:hypothetical protein